MKDAPLDLTSDTPVEGQDWDESVLPLELVRELCVVLAKALRAYQLYDENNPVYQRFISALRDAFRGLWDEVDSLRVQVGEDTLKVGEAEVYRSDSRSDSLAFLLFKDGIRELTFRPGIEDEELTRFLGILQKARSLRPDEDDLLTLLWEEDLVHLRYQYVDLLAEGVELPETGEGHTAPELQAVLESEAPADPEHPEGGAVAEPPSETVRSIRQDDFNPTLYSLDAREMDTLREEIRREMERDIRSDVLSALMDRLEEPEEREVQSEILEIFQQLLPNFLSRGLLQPAAHLLAQLRELEGREDVLDAEGRRQVSQTLDLVSSPETLEELVRAVEDGSVRPPPAVLSRFLSHLRPAALPTLVRAAEVTDVREIQPVLREAVRGIAERNRRALVELLEHRDPAVMAGAARLAGRMQVTEAGPAMAHLLRHERADVRLAAVEAARDLRASTAASALVEALSDDDREVRVGAVRALGALRYRPAARDLAALIDSKALRDADVTERIAFFESYGLLAGEEAVARLDRLLNRRGFLGRRESSEIRACAALGLGKVDADAAREALRKALDEEDPVVRTAVNRALRGEEA